MGAPGSSVIEAGQHELAKKCYKNQTAGWLGVTKLNHLGAQEGAPVKPYGTVYLSDVEAQLTARAPADAKDNPFVEQQFEFEDAEGRRVMQSMRPLVLVTDEREIPEDEHQRYVPGAEVGDHPTVGTVAPESAEAAARADTEDALAGESTREVPLTPVTPRLAPSHAAAVPPSQTRPGAPPEHAPPPPEEDHPSWTENPERSEQAQRGALGGSNDTVGPADGEIEGETGSNQKQATPTPVGGLEEHAAHTESGEETGAAATPSGEAPEGEFASTEEVGSPDAPTKKSAD